MADTVAIKVTADIVDLQTKFTLAKAQSQQLSTELNKLAREAVAAGGATPQLNSQLQQIAAQSIQAKDKLVALSTQLKAGQTDTRSFGSAINVGREALAAFGLAMSAEAIVEFGKKVFDSAAEIYHEAEVLGMTTTNLQLFTESAKLAGVSTDAVDLAIRKFNLSQGQAATGTGLQAKAFNDLGVSAKLPADQALPAVARALLAITDVARRSRDEVALFGKAGEEMNPALEQWARGTDALNAELSAQGLILSDETAKGAHDAKVAMDKAWDQVDVAWAPAVVALTKVITGLVDAYHAAYEAGEQFGELFDRIVGKSSAGKVNLDIDASDVAGSKGTPKVLDRQVGGPTPTPRPNFTDDADAKKAASEARQVADEIARIYEQGNQRHIQNEEQTNAHLLSMGRETLDQWRDQAVALEDERYQAAKDGLQKRAEADAGDKVRLARDMAEEAQLARDHADRLEQIDQQYTEKKQQEASSALAAFIKEQDEELAVATANFDRQFREQKISADQRHASEVDLTRQIEDEVLRRFDAEHASLVQGTAAYEDAMRQRAEIATKYNKVVRDADTKLANDQALTYETANRQILSVESNFISGFLSGRNTLGQSALQLFTQLLEREIEADLAYWTERALLAMEGIGKEKTQQQLGFLAQLFMDQSKADSAAQAEVSKTAAVVAGEAARLGAQEAGAAAGNAVHAAASSVSIINDAKTAAAGAYAALADIPVIGPELGAAAAVATFTAVMAYDTMASFDVGTNMVPHDMVAMVHQGERIIPAADNSALMAAVNQNIGNNGGGNNFGGDIHLHLMAPPGTTDPARFGRIVAKSFRNEIRNGNLDLQKAMNGT